MLDALRFVQGAVARKDFDPALVHFHIHKGMVQGYNGAISLCSPIALDLDVTPNAIQLVKAMQACTETAALSITPSGKLAIKSGRFRAFVDCFPGGFPEIAPTGVRYNIPAGFLKALMRLEPCVAEDASRQWARGVLCRGKSMFATNNVVLVEHWVGDDFPLEMNIPVEAVRELIRIRQEPDYLLAADNCATFFFGDRWLRAQLYTSQWPDLAKVLERPCTPTPVPIDDEQLLTLLPFVDALGKVYLVEGAITTSLVEGEGASLEIPGLPAAGAFNLSMLRLALPLAATMDLTQSPAPCLFFGDNLRGAIIGMRQ